MVLYIFKTLSFEEFTAQISLRDPENPNKYIGSTENWNKAEAAIIEATAEKGLKTVIEYGELLYGPKLRLHGEGCIRKKLAIRNHSS